MEHEAPIRVLLILGVALGAHLVALSARWLSRRSLRSRIGSETKILTITGFATSSLIFAGDWMVTVHYRAEPPGGEPGKRLPRPSALAAPKSGRSDTRSTTTP